MQMTSDDCAQIITRYTRCYHAVATVDCYSTSPIIAQVQSHDHRLRMQNCASVQPIVGYLSILKGLALVVHMIVVMIVATMGPFEAGKVLGLRPALAFRVACGRPPVFSACAIARLLTRSIRAEGHQIPLQESRQQSSRSVEQVK